MKKTLVRCLTVMAVLAGFVACGPSQTYKNINYMQDITEETVMDIKTNEGILVQPNRNQSNGQYVATVAFDPLAGEVSIVNSALASVQRDAVEIDEPITEGRDADYDLSVDDELEDASSVLAQEEADAGIGEIVADIAEQVR